MRHPKPLAFLGGALVVAVASAAALAAGTVWSDRHRDTAAAAPPATRTLAATIDAYQHVLRTRPDDAATWADLGGAYVEQARLTADPSWYPKADGALHTSLRLRPDGNPDALVGLAALANARHDFAAAADLARQAITVDPYSSTAYGSLDDALTQLGDYPGATDALERMLDLKPGVAAFTRASYEFEEHGRTDEARQALERALADAGTAADRGFCRYYLGELAFNTGDLADATRQYASGLRDAPDYAPLLAGRAKAEAAAGHPDRAARDYATVIGRLPLPQYLLEYGEVLAASGHAEQAGQQYALLGAEQKLFAANGVLDDLTSAQYEADHGDPAAAVARARAEWSRRHSVLVADALAWALHRAGQDAEALGYAQQGPALGWRNATFSYHLGMIEKAMGHTANARADLTAALATNPHFSPSQAPIARQALAELGGAA
jgi:tetratricopeptide (TPR) repeat protein